MRRAERRRVRGEACVKGFPSEERATTCDINGSFTFAIRMLPFQRYLEARDMWM